MRKDICMPGFHNRYTGMPGLDSYSMPGSATCDTGHKALCPVSCGSRVSMVWFFLLVAEKNFGRLTRRSSGSDPACMETRILRGTFFHPSDRLIRRWRGSFGGNSIQKKFMKMEGPARRPFWRMRGSPVGATPSEPKLTANGPYSSSRAT